MTIIAAGGVMSVNANRAKSGMTEAYVNGVKGYYRKELSEGAKNTLLRARQMYEVEWTPLQDMSMYDTEEETPKQFLAGVTYKGIPYGQPVHQGEYVGQTVTIKEFIDATKDPNSKFYTDRGLNTWYYDEGAGDGKIRFGPYMASDCSSFVSYCWMLDHRTTTASMEADPDRFIVLGKDYQVIEPSMAINKGGVHVVLIYDVIYDKDGKVAGITTIEQTPPIMTVRSYGVGGTTGTLADFQAKLDNGYDIIRYRDIENVKYEKIEGVDKDRTFVSGVEYPISDVKLSDAAEGVTVVPYDTEKISISGWAFHKDEFKSFTISVNGGKEKKLKAEKRDGYAEASGLYYDFADNKGKNYYSGTIEADFADGAEAVVYGTTGKGNKVQLAVIKIVEEGGDNKLPRYESYFDSGIFEKDDSGAIYKKQTISEKSELMLSYSGWTVCKDNVLRFEVRVDDGPWQEISADFRNDVYKVKKGSYKNCRNLNAHIGNMDLTYLDEYGTHTIELRGVTLENGVFSIARWEFENEKIAPGVITLWSCIGVGVVAAVVTTVVLCVKGKKRKAVAGNDVVSEGEAVTENVSENEMPEE